MTRCVADDIQHMQIGYPSILQALYQAFAGALGGHTHTLYSQTCHRFFPTGKGLAKATHYSIFVCFTDPVNVAISRNTEVAKAPGSRVKLTSKSCSSQRQLASCGCNTSGRRSCCRPTCSSPEHHDAQGASVWVSRSSVCCAARERPRPHIGPVGYSCGSPGRAVRQLPCSTRALSTWLNSHDRAADRAMLRWFRLWILRRSTSNARARCKLLHWEPKRCSPK